MYYFRRRWVTETTVGTWTAIDAADRGNGCLYVVPGSHRLPVAEHDDLEGSQQAEFKLARGVRDQDGVALEVAPGSVIWFHSHLLHKSTDNHSGRFRRSYVAHYLSAQGRVGRPGRASRPAPPQCGSAAPHSPARSPKSTTTSSRNEQMMAGPIPGTYVWIATNRKEKRRRGRVQLVDDRDLWTPGGGAPGRLERSVHGVNWLTHTTFLREIRSR